VSADQPDSTTGPPSDRELHELFTLSLAMLCIADPRGYFRRVNPAFVTTLGYTERELLARPFLELVHPDDREATLRELACLADGIPTARFQNRYRHKDGSYRWLSWTAMPDGNGSRIYAAAMDVTDAKEAEAALRRSEERYRGLLGAVTTYTYSVHVGEDGPSRTEHSPTCLAATGYTPEEYAGDGSLWIDMVHPDDRARVLQQVARVLEGKAVAPIEHRIRHKDGTTRWVRDTIVSHRGPDGRLARYDGLVEDITDRKTAEEQYRHLMESAPDGMVMVDGEGGIVLANGRVEELFGYRLDELTGRPIELLVPAALRERHRALREQYQRKPRPRSMGRGMELVGRRKDGTEFPAEIALSPQYTEGGGLLVTCVIHDITARKAAQRTILENEAQLLAAQRIQQYLLPTGPPAVEGFEIAGATCPANFAAGDYYDFLSLADGSTGVVVADVSGHGVASALLMASTRAYLRSLATHHDDIVEMLTHADEILAREIEPGNFITLFLGRLDPGTRTFEYASAGHPTGYVLGADGRVLAELPSTSMPLGLHVPVIFSRGGPVALAEGSMVLLLTDGVLEASSPADESFGAERAIAVARAARARPARQIVEAFREAVCGFTGAARPADDVTAVVIKVLPQR